MNEHLRSNAIESSRERIENICNDTNKLLDDIEDVIDENGCNFLKETIASKAIPTPKLSIKDHAKPNKDRDFPMRMAIPATNFTSGFPKLGFSGIEKIFDKNDINHAKKTMCK